MNELGEHEILDRPEEDPYKALDKWLDGVQEGDPKYLALINRAQQEAFEARITDPDEHPDGKSVARESLAFLSLTESALRQNPQIRDRYSEAKSTLRDLVGKDMPIWVHHETEAVMNGRSPQTHIIKNNITSGLMKRNPCRYTKNLSDNSLM